MGRWGSQSFPNKRSFVASFRGALAAAQPGGRTRVIVIGAAGAVLVTGLTAGVVRYERLAKSEHAALLRTEMANAELQAELARLRDRVGASNKT